MCHRGCCPETPEEFAEERRRREETIRRAREKQEEAEGARLLAREAYKQKYGRYPGA